MIPQFMPETQTNEMSARDYMAAMFAAARITDIGFPVGIEILNMAEKSYELADKMIAYGKQTGSPTITSPDVDEEQLNHASERTNTEGGDTPKPDEESAETIQLRQYIDKVKQHYPHAITYGAHEDGNALRIKAAPDGLFKVLSSRYKEDDIIGSGESVLSAWKSAEQHCLINYLPLPKKNLK